MKKQLLSIMFAGVLLVGCNAAKTGGEKSTNDLASLNPIETTLLQHYQYF